MSEGIARGVHPYSMGAPDETPPRSRSALPASCSTVLPRPCACGCRASTVRLVLPTPPGLAVGGLRRRRLAAQARAALAWCAAWLKASPCGSLPLSSWMIVVYILAAWLPLRSSAEYHVCDLAFVQM